MFNESFFRANPLDYFKENGWVLDKEDKSKILIALGEMAKDKVRNKQIGAILLNLAKYNPDLKKIFIAGANKYIESGLLPEECERDKKRKKQIEFDEYSLTQSKSSKLKKALAILCMVWAVQGLAPAKPAETNQNIKTQTTITRTVNENKIGDKKMDLRTFLIKEGCCGKVKCAKDFEEKEDELEVEKKEEGGDEGNFEFLIKAKVAGLDEKEAKKRLEDALDGFDVKIKAKKAEKKEEEVDESVVEEGVAGGVVLGLLGFAVIKNIIMPMLAKGFMKFARNFSINANKASIKGMAQRMFDLYNKNTGMSRSDFKKLVLNDSIVKRHADTIAKCNNNLSLIKKERMKNGSFGDDPLETVKDLNKGITDVDQVIEWALNEMFKAEDEAKKEQAAKKFNGKNLIRKVTAIEHPEEGGEDAGACCGAKKFKKAEMCPQCGRDFKHCTCGR